MADYQIVFYDREFHAAIGLDGKFTVEKMDYESPGGAKNAELILDCRDIENELERVAGVLRYGVDIVDGVGQVVWNGFVHEIEMRLGGFEVRIGLDGLANRVAVRYIDLKPSESWSQADGISGFVEDEESIEQYGRKEWIGQINHGTPAQAAAAALTWLKSKKDATRKKAAINGIKNEKVILHCRGWWETLDWIYYSQEAGFVGHLQQGKREQTVGNSSVYQKVAQKIIFPQGGFVAAEVWLRVSKTGDPDDEIVVEITDDEGGKPGSTIFTAGSVSGWDLTGGYKWVRFALAAAEVGEIRNRWLVVRRSGVTRSINYYQLQVDDAMEYRSGEVKTWGGSTWAVRSEDLNFAVLAAEETTKQIKRMATAGGQFLRGVRICDASGVKSLLWREMRETCGEEIRGMLASGTSAGEELDAAIDGERNLVVRKKEREREWKIGG